MTFLLNYLPTWNTPTTAETSEPTTDSNNNDTKQDEDDWQIVDKSEIEKEDQHHDESSPNYVCPSVNYDFAADLDTYVAVFDYAHGVVTDESFYANDD